MNGGPKSEGCEAPPNGYNGPTKPEVAVPGEPNTPTDGMGPIQSSNLKTNHGGDSQTRAANLGATVTAAFSVPAEECKNESAKGAEPNGDNGPPKPEIAVTDRAPEANSFNPTEKVTIEDDVENDGEELPDEIPGRVDEPNEEPVGNFKVSLEGSVLNDEKKIRFYQLFKEHNEVKYHRASAIHTASAPHPWEQSSPGTLGAAARPTGLLVIPAKTLRELKKLPQTGRDELPPKRGGRK